MNWFRRDEDGGFLWPGFGENSRVLKWVIERLEGTAAAVETPIGHVPTPDSLDVVGPGHDAASRSSRPSPVDAEEWREEIPQIEEWFAKFGDKLPSTHVGRAGDPEEPARLTAGPPPSPSDRARSRASTSPSERGPLVLVSGPAPAAGHGPAVG